MLDKRETGELKIQGNTYEECLQELRKRYELNNYFIDKKRQISAGGIKGFFGKTKWEVIYRLLAPVRPRYTAKPAAGEEGDDFDQQKQRVLNIAGKAPNPQLDAISRMIKDLDSKVTTLASDKPAVTSEHPAIQRVAGILESNEFTPSIVKNIARRLKQELTLEELDNEETVQERMAFWIGELIKVESPPVAEKNLRVIVLVGPTGEGKTTTIAKLAAAYRKKDSAEHEHQICMITIDQLRVAAGRQVETYARVLKTDFASGNSAKDIREIVAGNDKLDVLLIDTAGYSPNDFGRIGQMREILNIPELRPEIYLVVSASKKTGDLLNIIKNYELFNCKAVIVTKLDETDRIGNVVSALAEKNKAVAYVTTGQTVSSDIKVAEPLDFLHKLADIKIRSVENG
ncbi:MAG: hypothetical protein LBS97_03745 [Treponema sp.]|jgi:flagellar biosynthesis protein FlhF|nr:hypothetical protein [Treponema sp.]